MACKARTRIQQTEAIYTAWALDLATVHNPLDLEYQVQIVRFLQRCCNPSVRVKMGQYGRHRVKRSTKPLEGTRWG